jgi:hypothetical protein
MVDIEDEDEPPVTQNQYQSKVEEVVEETPAHTQETPEHPFGKAKDAVYILPVERNVGIKDKTTPTVTKKPKPAYRTLPPIYNPAIAVNVLKQSMEAPITITQKELLSSLPEVCFQVHDSIMTCRIPKEIVMVHSRFEEQEEEEEEEEEEEPKTQFLVNAVPVAFFTVHRAHHRTPPQGSFIINDPMEEYYKSLSPGEKLDPDWIIVAMKSSAICSVFALMDNSQKRKCILDPGCQIITMSKNSCHDLGLMYDPAIILHMQSINRNINQLLGSSYNVPF